MERKEEALLEMKGIDKQFPGTHALNCVDFTLKQGEVHALIGQNGSGKSTLMNILSGGLRMDKGEILLRGQKVNITSPVSALENGIAMIHQELKLFPELTVAENIFFGRFQKKHGRINWNKLYAMGDEAMSPLSKEIKGRQKVKELSVAQQQLVEIVRALSKNTEVVIMDEPSASLTDEETRGLFRTIDKIKREGISIIFISHRLDEVLSISDCITVLRDGELIGTLKREEVKDKGQLVNMMINIKATAELKRDKYISQEVVLETKNLSFGRKLCDVNFSLKKGEVLGIAGLMGAGRTELLKTIFGAFSPTSGSIVVRGKSYSRLTPRQAVKLGIAYMSEDRKGEGLLLKMSIQDNEIYASLDKFSRGGVLRLKMRDAMVSSMEEKLRLKASSPTEHVGVLSGGNQQKVVIAKWLAAQSDIILMDEPTRGIDVGAKGEIYLLVRELAKEGKSIIFISSELEEVQTVSDRILVMKEGTIIKELPENTGVEEMMHYAV